MLTSCKLDGSTCIQTYFFMRFQICKWKHLIPSVAYAISKIHKEQVRWCSLIGTIQIPPGPFFWGDSKSEDRDQIFSPKQLLYPKHVWNTRRSHVTFSNQDHSCSPWTCFLRIFQIWRGKLDILTVVIVIPKTCLEYQEEVIWHSPIRTIQVAPGHISLTGDRYVLVQILLSTWARIKKEFG